MTVDDFDTGERISRKIQPFIAFAGVDERLVRFLQRRCVLRQTDDVFAHQAEDRQVQARVREPFYLVHVVIGGELARPGFGKIGKYVDALQVIASQVLIAQPSGAVTRKCRMRLVADAGLDADFVQAEGDVFRIRRNLRARGVQVHGLRHLHRGQRNQRIGALEIVILQRRLVDLRVEHGLVLAVGLGRVEVLGALDEGGVKDIFAAIRGRIGLVPYLPAPGEPACKQRHEEEWTGHGGQV